MAIFFTVSRDVFCRLLHGNFRTYLVQLLTLNQSRLEGKYRSSSWNLENYVLISFAFVGLFGSKAFCASSSLSILSDAELESVVKSNAGEAYYNAMLSQVNERVARERIHTFGMNGAEMYCLNEYIHTSYVLMNSCLRSDLKMQSCDYAAPCIEATARALNKFPDYDGRAIRTTHLPANELFMHRTGLVVTYHAFTSAAVDPVRSYGDEIFIINCKHGKNISEFSNLPGEREILFPPGTKFQVTKRSLDLGGLFQVKIEMSETQH